MSPRLLRIYDSSFLFFIKIQMSNEIQSNEIKIAATAKFHYQLTNRDAIIAKVKALAGAEVVDNGDYGKSENAKTARSYFSFFMPTDEGSKLVAQLISYEGKGNVFVDFINKLKFVDNQDLIRKSADLDTIVSAMA